MSSPPHDPLIGAHLDGRYRVSGLLGRGGMGVVYEGVHEELGRAVAIKVLFPAHATDAIVVERFVREARIASGLSHGNIVEVSDLGRLPDGRPYLVMPKVHGVDFATLLARETSLSPARVVSLLRGVAAALDLVHAEGLVHRDVKPENLMHVVRADGSENVLLMDFGIAALLGDEAGRLTERGMRCGTPAYMAPEFIETGAFDRRADVYALATVAFEMLTGRLPFAETYAQRMMYEKTNRAAPSLRAVSGRPFDSALERVVARGLVRDPALRYPSTGEFVAALERAARDGVIGSVAEPIAGDAPTVRLAAPLGKSTIAPLRRGARARRAAFGVAFVALLAAGALSLAHRAPPAPGAARSSTAPATDVVAPPTAGVTTAIAPDPVVLPSASPRDADAARAPAPAPAPVLAPRGTRRRPTAMPSQSAEGRSAPNDPAPELRAIATDAPPPDPDRTALDALERAADRELLSGHLARAVELFEHAIALDTKRVAAYRGLGIAHERLGHTAAAVRAYRNALALEPEGEHSGQLRARLRRLDAGE